MVHKKAKRTARRLKRKAGLFAKFVTAVAKPIVLGIGKLTGKTFTPQTATQLTRSKVGSTLGKAFAVTATALAVAAAPATLARVGGTAGRKLLVGGATGLGIGIASQPAKLIVLGGLLTTVGGRKLIVSGIKGLFKGSQKLGELVEETPKIPDISLTDVAVLGGGTGLLLAGASQLPNLFDKKDDAPSIPDVPETLQDIPEVPAGAPTPDIAELPVTPQTEVITPSTPTKKRRKKAKRSPSLHLTQKVSVSINQDQRHLNLVAVRVV